MSRKDDLMARNVELTPAECAEVYGTRVDVEEYIACVMDYIDDWGIIHWSANNLIHSYDELLDNDPEFENCPHRFQHFAANEQEWIVHVITEYLETQREIAAQNPRQCADHQ